MSGPDAVLLASMFLNPLGLSVSNATAASEDGGGPAQPQMSPWPPGRVFAGTGSRHRHVTAQCRLHQGPPAERTCTAAQSALWGPHRVMDTQQVAKGGGQLTPGPVGNSSIDVLPRVHSEARATEPTAL